jgi:hypothetical protein
VEGTGVFHEATDLPDYSMVGQNTGDSPSASSRRRPRGRRSWWLALLVVAAVLAGGAFWAGTEATSPSQLGKQYAAAPLTVLTASVVLRRLSETLPVEGTVASEEGYPVNFGPVNVPGAQPIVTRSRPAWARGLLTARYLRSRHRCAT